VVAEPTILASVFELAANLEIVTAIGLSSSNNRLPGRAIVARTVAVPQAILLRAGERIPR
jgi:hypothetical protein